jgi:sugar/nucleoside kinase (ribokinase family)
MDGLAVVGNLSIDIVDGRPPSLGGGPYWAARGLPEVGTPAAVTARSGDDDRDFVLPQLIELEVDVVLLHGRTSSSFSIMYTNGARSMVVEAIGDSWTPDDARQLDPSIGWVHVAPLLRSDFPPATLAELARGRVVSLDAQGLVRRSQLGPLTQDPDFDPALLEHLTILKLAEEEAEVIGDVSALTVPEIIVTLGERGALVLHEGTEQYVPTNPLYGVNPTGAGDAFAMGYLAARAQGLGPVEAARRANAVAGAVIG